MTALLRVWSADSLCVMNLWLVCNKLEVELPNTDALTWSDVRDNFDAKAAEVGVLAETDRADKRALSQN